MPSVSNVNPNEPLALSPSSSDTLVHWTVYDRLHRCVSAPQAFVRSARSMAGVVGADGRSIGPDHVQGDRRNSSAKVTLTLLGSAAMVLSGPAVELAYLAWAKTSVIPNNSTAPWPRSRRWLSA